MRVGHWFYTLSLRLRSIFRRHETGMVPGAVATGRLLNALSAGARSLPLPVPYRRVRQCWLFRFSL